MSNVIITDQLVELEDLEDPYNTVIIGELNLAGVELALGICDDQCWSP